MHDSFLSSRCHVEVLPPILGALHAQHPEPILELTLSNEEDLLLREADIAVRMVAPQQDALLARRIGSVALGLFAHADYLERRGLPQSVEELGNHAVIGFDRLTPSLRAMIEKAPRIADLSFALRADNHVAQLPALRAGFGLGLCQLPIAARMPKLVRLLADEFQMPLEFWVVMHENLRSAARYRAVFDALVADIGAYIAS